MQRLLGGAVLGASVVGALWYFVGLEKMRTRGNWDGPALLAVPPAAPCVSGSQTPSDRAEAPSANNAMETEASGALFWFNWKEISEGGNSLYGAYVYQHLLPILAPGSGQAPAGWVVLFDGDLFSDLPPQIQATGAAESNCLGEVRRVGPKQCYVVAMFGVGTSYSAIDETLHRAGITGYLGKTSCPGLDAQGFVRLTQSLSLPVSARVEGTMFKKIGFEFISDDRLRTMGFNPVRANR